MVNLLIMIASQNDEPFLRDGVGYLKKNNIAYEIVIGSTHREPEATSVKIVAGLKRRDLKVVISGAATATGLPGIIAGYLIDTNIPIYGVRFTKEPGQSIIEDASFSLSSMPEGVPLAYTGYNEKGVLHACMLAARIIKESK
ncbi:MAG TPA: AIR carboxylase family protein [Candidatus Bathyarchaeia archaeon]|nr:AIR carboxylase family protein [Candidatus Bathyarchaeia archaeon]